MPTQRFWNLPEEKQRRVEAAAVAEFAQHGFEHANTNRIATAAEVSVGALFKYFPTKDDLFRHVVGLGAAKLETQVQKLVEMPGGILTKLEALLRVVMETSRTDQSRVQLYHEITATGNRELSHAMSMELEGFTSKAYTQLLTAAQATGEVRDDIPPGMLAWLVDNVLMNLQYALACGYYIDRLGMYAPDADDETIVQSTLAFLATALGLEH